MICLKDLWAKTTPFQSVITHGSVSGTVAQELLLHFISAGTRKQLCAGLRLQPDQLISFVGYFVSLHDIGKIHYYFQSKDPDTKEKLKREGMGLLDIPGMQFRHEQESGRAIRKIWEKHDRRTARHLSEILAAHHQVKPICRNADGAEGEWFQLQEQYEHTMAEHFAPVFPVMEKEKDSVISAVLLGLVILSDWIASGEYFADAETWLDITHTAREKVQSFLHESGLWQTACDYGKSFYEVWPNIPVGGARELQSKMEELLTSPERFSFILVEAPMGEGKTEAGVYAALELAKQWEKNGFYAALPTSATANQMVGRMRELLAIHNQEESVKLLHAMAWMVDDLPEQEQVYQTEEDCFARNWLMPLRRGLLAPYAVGTVDQAMMGAMFIKYGVLRLLGLSGKALIIDEIHAYDTYMQNILEGLLTWCKALEIPVVLLSATLPPEKKQRLLGGFTQESISEAYPAITAISEDGHVQVVPITHVAKHQVYRIEKLPILHEPERIAAYAVTKTEQGGCMCVLLNTVAQAQEVYQAVKALHFTGELRLFHSRFPAERRDEIEKECIQMFGKEKSRRPQRAILVATQVVEQSLDVDFDYMISAAAPIDLLIQRMGRLYRHEDTPRPVGLTAPVFSVLIPGDGHYGKDGFVYPECLLKQSVHLLQDRDTIRVPDDIADLVADGYDGEKVPPEELEKWMENLVEEEMQGTMADRYKLSSPEKRFRPLVDIAEYDDLEQQSYLSAQTRLSEPTVCLALLDESLYGQILPQVREGILSVKNISLARRILGRGVSVRKKIYDEFASKSNLLDINGDKLIVGVKILPKDNLYFRDDPELGLIWKEEIK